MAFRAVEREKDELVKKCSWELANHLEEKNQIPYSIPCATVHFRWIRNLSVRQLKHKNVEDRGGSVVMEAAGSV